MSKYTQSLTTINGIDIPMLGLGTFRSSAQECVEAVRAAVDAGYRCLDTANFYENEAFVGQGVRECGIPRDQLFITSKIWPTGFTTPAVNIEYSLRALNVGYIDLYLLHWPGLDKDARYRAFEKVLEYKQKGLFREIGVSNFKREHLEDLIAKFGVVPAVNQIELSPWLQKREDYAYCKEKGIVMTACVPFAKGNILSDEKLTAIAEKHGKNVGQVILRWNIQRGNCVIPKSSKPSRIRSNAEIFDFTLDDADMNTIFGMENGNHYCSDSSSFTGDFWNLTDYLAKNQ